MSKHKSTILWVIFLVFVVGVLVYCFFEKKEKEIEQSIHQLETTHVNSENSPVLELQGKQVHP